MIRNANKSDYQQILQLNLEFEKFLSPLNEVQLAELHDSSSYCKVIDYEGDIAGFLIAFREGAPYESVNYHWFSKNYSCFAYIDRIVVSKSHQGKKFGESLYNDLFDVAKAHEVPLVTCEYNVKPLNEGSKRFHSKLGFHEVGTQTVNYGQGTGDKIVSMQIKEIDL